jgi:hypothetical protein
MSIITKETRIKLKNGKYCILIEEIEPIYFPNEIWNMIKDFIINPKIKTFIKIISKEECKNLNIKNEYTCDISRHIDLKKLKIKMKLTKPIKKILVKDRDNYINISNKYLKYKEPIMAWNTDDGAYLSCLSYICGFYWVVERPIGTAVIVI